MNSVLLVIVDLMIKTLLLTSLAMVLGAGYPLPVGASPRRIPHSLPDHPGNIFLAGENVSVGLPPGEGDTWQAWDYEGRIVATGSIKDGLATAGQLPIGYFEIGRVLAPTTNRVSVGVLAPLRTPTPPTSPVAVDVAMAWFYPKAKMPTVANLCALAGMNRVRDRLSWPELEPHQGEFAPSNRYDWSAQAQADASLQVLQVGHRSPAWANPDGSRFPLDLRDTYTFHREMARRWRGQVVAFEPWNEADISMFGGHTGSEMASLQKAAYFGLKSGNPRVVACLNVLAEHRSPILQDLHANAAWPYFDTFNLHHYEGFSHYPKLYADFRAVSAGRPLWVTECSLPVKWRGDARLQEPTADDLRVQSERLTVTYALALHEGAQAVFYFMLPHYVEGQTQFGVLRQDLTPRPAFVALAAVGRLLAAAKPLGRLQPGSESIEGYLFEAKPDGEHAKVLVIWAAQETSFEMPNPPRACFDHLGRALEVTGGRLKLSRAPLFVKLAKNTQLPLARPPEPPQRLPGKPCPVVLQALMPKPSTVLRLSAYKVPKSRPASISIYVYNFGSQPARGHLSAVVAPGTTNTVLRAAWKAEFSAELEIAPGDRKELPLQLTPAVADLPIDGTVRITGDFGKAGQTVLSFRIVQDSE
jgi:hypothetical protein